MVSIYIHNTMLYTLLLILGLSHITFFGSSVCNGQGAEEVDHVGPQLIDGRVHYAHGTRKNLDALVQSGLYGMALERKYNGLNFPRVVEVMAAEMIARADVGFATIWGLQDCAETIQHFASE